MSEIEHEELIQLYHPNTGKAIFVNLKSNQYYNEIPSSAKCRIANNDNDWWELMDSSKKLYYYNSASKKAVWTRPESGNILSLSGIENLSIDIPRSSILGDKNVNSIINSPKISPMSDLPKNDTSQPNGVESRQLSAISGGAHKSSSSTPKMPTELKNDISQFKIDGYALKYFTTQRRGLFRRKVPIEKMLEYQKDAIPGPLLNLSPALHKDAVKCFKLLQNILSSKGTLLDSFDDIQSLLEKGIRTGSLRDEILVQSCKQLTKNPKPDQVERGWQMMGVLVATFPPSKNLENYLKTFLMDNFNSGGEGSSMDIVIRFAFGSLNRTCKTGPRGRSLTRAELDQALQAPFKNSVFGDTLDNIMERQSKEEPELHIPKVLITLVDAILRLEGQKTEGIFRVPGEAEGVSDLKCRIDKNDYDFSYLNDPNIPSSLLKLWLRELHEPLIPSQYYPACVAIGQKLDDPSKTSQCLKDAKDIIDSLPEMNRKVVHFMIKFLKKVAEPQNQPITKMSAANVAMVFAPNFVRCPSDDPVVIFENTKFEQAFLKVLIASP